MAEETQVAQQPRRADDHTAAAAAPEQHLLEDHKLSIRVQGKEGPRGQAVWALVKEEKGRVKTLTVFEGTRREAAHHFFAFMHPNYSAAPVASTRPSAGGFRSGGRSGRPTGRPQGRR